MQFDQLTRREFITLLGGVAAVCAAGQVNAENRRYECGGEEAAKAQAPGDS